MCAGVHGEAGRPHFGKNDEVARFFKGINLPTDGFSVSGQVFPNKWVCSAATRRRGRCRSSVGNVEQRSMPWSMVSFLAKQMRTNFESCPPSGKNGESGMSANPWSRVPVGLLSGRRGRQIAVAQQLKPPSAGDTCHRLPCSPSTSQSRLVSRRRKLVEVVSAGLTVQKGGNTRLEGRLWRTRRTGEPFEFRVASGQSWRFLAVQWKFLPTTRTPRPPQPQFVRYAEDLTSVVVHRSIDFITHHECIGALDQIRQPTQILAAPRRAGWVVGHVDNPNRFVHAASWRQVQPMCPHERRRPSCRLQVQPRVQVITRRKDHHITGWIGA